MSLGLCVLNCKCIETSIKLIVAELGKNLSAARRKDLDEGEYCSNLTQRKSGADNVRRDVPKPVNRSQSAKTLGCASTYF